MKAKKKRLSSSARFAIVMLVYALCFLAALGLLLPRFWDYIEAYELSHPQYAMEEYMAALDEGRFRELTQDFIATLDQRFQTPEESFAVIREALAADALRYESDRAESRSSRASYRVFLGEREIGHVAFLQGTEGDYGFKHWELSEERYDFSWLRGAGEVIADRRWTVYANGRPVDSSSVSGEAIPYASLADYYDRAEFSELPYLLRYRVDNILGAPRFTAIDGAGATAALPDPDALPALPENCSEGETAELSAFLSAFLPKYILCLSNSTHNEYGNYWALRSYMLPNSDIDRRMYDAIAGQYWAHGKVATIRNLCVNGCVSLGNSYYLLDFSYVLDTQGSYGTVASDNNAQLILYRTSEGLKATEIASY